MSRLTRDGTAEPVSRDQILRHVRGQGNIIFLVQLTTSRIGNLTRLIHTLLHVMTIHTVFTKTSSIQSMYPYLCTAVLGYSTLHWRYFYQTRANGCIETEFHHNECTQHVVSLNGGHVVRSAVRSSTATARAFVVWNSWSRRYAPQMRENLLPVRIIRRQKAATYHTCTDHPVGRTVITLHKPPVPHDLRAGSVQEVVHGRRVMHCPRI